MAGKSTLTADAAEQAALRALSKSEQRGEADRARAIPGLRACEGFPEFVRCEIPSARARGINDAG
jgi:hypothetical protein